MAWIANQLVSWAINVFACLTNLVGALVMAAAAVLLWMIDWHRRRRREGKSSVQAWHLLVTGMAGTWLFLTIGLGAAAWMAFNRENLSAAGLSAAPRRDEGPLEWYYNLTMEGGPLSGRNVFALRFRGSNTSQKEVQLKRANIVSALKGSDLPLEIEAEGEIIPIEQAALIPPGAPIVLIAKFGPPDPNAAGKILGLEPKIFLEAWRQFSLNIEDDTRKYRLSFNEAHITAFFPGMVGPHVSKREQQNARR
jgi:hypothetical protein